MALTVTNRGTGTHNTGAATLVPGGRTGTLAVGSMGVLLMALDNAGSAGSTLIAPDSWTDAKGNVWTLQRNALFDNGAASAGIEMAIYTAPITTALLTTDLGTMTWKSGSPVAKAWTWYEVIPSGANSVIFFASGNIAGATAANATVGTLSIDVGDAVVAGYFAEGVAAVTADSDTTNGSWTAQQTATIGATTSGVRIASQAKVQTTVGSTQSYDVTVASQDRIAGYIVLHELVQTVVSPPGAALVLTGYEPTVTAGAGTVVEPPAAALVLTPAAPTVTVTAHQVVQPPAAALLLTGHAPTVSTPLLVTPGSLALLLVGAAPTVAVSDHKIVSPGSLALALTPAAPTVTVGANQIVTPLAAALLLTGYEPTVTAGAGLVVTPGSLSLVLSPYAPTATVSAHQTVTPLAASLTLTGYAPTVTAGGITFDLTLKVQAAAPGAEPSIPAPPAGISKIQTAAPSVPPVIPNPPVGITKVQ